MFTVYVLELLTTPGFYVGVSQNFSHRLRKHQQREGAVVTRTYGVKRVVYQEEQPTKELAHAREDALVLLYAKQCGRDGRCWGGSYAALKEPYPSGRFYVGPLCQ